MRLTMPVRSSWARLLLAAPMPGRWPAPNGAPPSPTRPPPPSPRRPAGRSPRLSRRRPLPHRRPGDLRGRGPGLGDHPDGLRLWCLFEVRRPGRSCGDLAATGWCWTGWRSAGSAPRCGGRPAGSRPCRWPGWAPTGTPSPSSCRAASTRPRPSSARSTCASSPRSGAAPPTWRWPATRRGGAGLRAPARGRLGDLDGQQRRQRRGPPGRPDPGPAGAAGLLGRRQGPVLRGQAAGRQPPARGLLAGRGQAPRPRLDGRAGRPGSSAGATRPPPRSRSTPAAAATTAGPTCRGWTAGRAGRCCRRRPGRPAPSAGSTPARCWWSRAAATGRSTCGWWT